MAPILPALLSILAISSAVQVEASPFGVNGVSVGGHIGRARKALHSLTSRYYGDRQGLEKPSSLGFKKRAANTVPAGWEYVGCAGESNGQRVLQGWSYSSGALTPLQCLTMCGGAGFTLGGMENGDECYCGNAYVGDGGNLYPDADCATPCYGDATQDCGAAWRLSMYKYSASAVGSACATASSTSVSATASATHNATSTSVSATKTSSSTAATSTITGATYMDTSDSSEWYSLGCAIDSANRILTGSFLDQTSMTIDSCLVICEDQGYKYAGLEYGSQCFCGATLASTVMYDTDAACWMKCAGNSGETCGAGYRMDMYELISSGSLEYCDATSSSSATPTVSLPQINNMLATGAIALTRGAPTALTRGAPVASTTSTSTSTSTTAVVVPTTSSTSIVVTASATGFVPNPQATGTVIGVSGSIPSTGRTHNVWAHFMVGNAYQYTYSDWVYDISQAKANGIDGFALNMGSDSWQTNRIADAYAAAAADGTFKMFLSLDMTVLSCNSQSDGQNLVNLVNSHGYSSAQALFNGKIIVSTFSGENCYFGYGSVSDGWTNAFKNSLPNVFFAPALFSDISTFASNSWMDGEFNWNSGWPMGGSDLTTSSDWSYMNALNGKEYMAGISPFFYTHFNQIYWGGKNWLYRGDDWLLCSRFEQIISMRDSISMMEIITWNDWGESSYITNIPTGVYVNDMPPSSDTWVQNFEHTALLPIIAYYSAAFKNGAYPAVTKDQIIMWSRPHPYNAVASSDSTGQPTNWQDTQDYVWAVVLATAPATFTLNSGSNSQMFTVAAGLNKMKLPNGVGSMSGSLSRNGATVASYNSGSAFQYTTTPSTYNFNYFVGGSS